MKNNFHNITLILVIVKNLDGFHGYSLKQKGDAIAQFLSQLLTGTSDCVERVGEAARRAGAERKSREGLSCRSSTCPRIFESKKPFLSTAFNLTVVRVFLARVEFLIPHSFQCYKLGMVDIICNPYLTEEIKEDQDSARQLGS